MSNYKEIKENLNLEDGVRNIDIKGRILITDELGRTILEKDNLVIMRGRVFALENLFKEALGDSGSTYKDNLNRKICLFKIGNGGANVNAAPMQPFVPRYSDEDLGNPIPFIIHDANKNTVPEKQNNPSVFSELTNKEKNAYYLPETNTDGSISYFGKVFDSNPRWTFDKSKNEIFKTIPISVGEIDARGYMINELGLVIGEYKSASNSYIDCELISRVTFDSISLTSLTKKLFISYFVYA